MPSHGTINKDDINRIIVNVTDPKTEYNFPAIATLVYEVCGFDKVKYEEAIRLIELFVRKAYENGFIDGQNKNE